MFGHLQRAITSGSHKLLPLNESLDSIHAKTPVLRLRISFPGATTLGQRSKSDAANFGRTNLFTDRIFSQARNTREADHGIEGQLHLLGSQRANHLDRNVEDGAWMDRQM